MLGKALPVGVFGVFLLQISGIAQDQLRDVAGRRRGEDRAGKAVGDKTRQISAMIQMRAGQDDRVDAGGGNGERLPIQLAQILQTLEQAAIDKDAQAAMAQEMFGAGDRAGAAETGEGEHG